MKNTYKKIFIVILSVLLIFVAVIPAFATETGDDLPHITRWVNGKAAGSDGAFLYDTWAVDDTGLSDSKFVLVNQEGIESMRIKNYPQDINSGEEAVIETYDVELTLKYPKDVESEIILTLENKNALYYVYFNEQNSFKATASFLPGEYLVTYVDVVTDTEGSYGLKDNDFKLEVKNKAVKEKLEIIRIKSDTKKVEAEAEKTENEAPVRNFDENGDLFGDTVRLFVFVVILFGVYLYIKRKREKEQEINK